MKALLAPFLALAPVIAVVNFAGGIVGGIWSAVNGDWWAIGYAFLGLIVSHWVISLLLVPGFAIGAAGAAAMQRGRIGVGRTAFAVSSLYQVSLMAAWALFVTAAFLGHSRNSSLFPMLLLAYGASVAPWAYLASKDQQSGNEYSGISVFLFQTGVFVGCALLLFKPENGFAFFVTPLAVAQVLNWALQQIVMHEAIKSELAFPSL